MIGTGMVADDYFGGAGGWDVACELLGIQVTGYEILDEARRTRAAAGLKTSEITDVRDVTTSRGEVDLQIGSPPCQSFSMAGKGAGRRALDAVLQVVASYREGRPMTYAEAAALMGDERTGLVVEPLRLALEGHPMFIAWEQVPPVLPVWEACADVLRRNGYSVVTGCLNAEQYGVPQTRKRAILIARRDGRQAYMPAPTNSRYYGRTPDRLDEGVDKWVSMAEALGWDGGPAVVGFPRLADTSEAIEIDGTVYRARDLRSITEPAFALTEKARSWCVFAEKAMGAGMVERYGERPGRTLDQPAFTIRANAGGMEPGGFRWVVRTSRATPKDHPKNGTHELDPFNRPAHTLTGASREWVHTPPGMAKSIRITVQEASVLQSFPHDYPWQGSLTKQFLQIGNAIPPLLAYRILATFLDEGRRHADPIADFFTPKQLSLFDLDEAA